MLLPKNSFNFTGNFCMAYNVSLYVYYYMFNYGFIIPERWYYLTGCLQNYKRCTSGIVIIAGSPRRDDSCMLSGLLYLLHNIAVVVQSYVVLLGFIELWCVKTLRNSLRKGYKATTPTHRRVCGVTINDVTYTLHSVVIFVYRTTLSYGQPCMSTYL